MWICDVFSKLYLISKLKLKMNEVLSTLVFFCGWFIINISMLLIIVGKIVFRNFLKDFYVYES